MSRYPDGMANPEYHDAEYICKDCDEHFEVLMIHDLGDISPYCESDERCPSCKSWNTEYYHG